MHSRVAVVLALMIPVACGDDTTGAGGSSGAGGDDLVVTVVGAGGGSPGCTVGDSIACQCPDGTTGSKVCTQNQAGETFYASCGPC